MSRSTTDVVNQAEKHLEKMKKEENEKMKKEENEKMKKEEKIQAKFLVSALTNPHIIQCNLRNLNPEKNTESF
ncbi:hypothetical protein ACF0H5_000996 [Mactra antiquata]